MTNVKNISIKGFLAQRGITPQTERGGYGMYLSPLREERTSSFKVDYGQNLWYDFGMGEGGSIIDLVARMENCSVGEAIRRLENEVSGVGTLNVGGGVPRASTSTSTSGGASSFSSHRRTSHENIITSPQHPNPASSRVEIVSVGELKHPALMDYLRERGIDLAVARKYCHEVRYAIGGREYFAIGFRNDAGGWELRNRNFKGSSTPKNITTIRGGRGGDTMIDTSTGIATASNTVMVFEGFVDFLSYLSMKQNPSPTIDTTVLNSVANLRRAIPFLESHRTVHAFLDNDEAGRKTLADLRELLLGSEVVDQSAFYRSHKDLNDYWREQVASKPRVENRIEDTNAADSVKRPAPIESTTAAVQIRRQTPTSGHPTADRFRRSMTVAPVKKRGRGV